MSEVRFNGRRWLVESESRKGVKYEVFYSLIVKRWMCTCPHFAYRLYEQGGMCKHIRTVLETMETTPTEELDRLKGVIRR